MCMLADKEQGGGESWGDLSRGVKEQCKVLPEPRQWDECRYVRPAPIRRIQSPPHGEAIFGNKVDCRSHKAAPFAGPKVARDVAEIRQGPIPVFSLISSGCTILAKRGALGSVATSTPVAQSCSTHMSICLALCNRRNSGICLDDVLLLQAYPVSSSLC